MPGFDGTGPRGMGPMTGGERGFCSPWGVGVRPISYRFPHRAGYGYTFGATPTREQELDLLKGESQTLKRTLEMMDTRIKELTGEGK